MSLDRDPSQKRQYRSERTAMHSESEWCFGMVTGLRPMVSQQYVLGKTPVALSISDDFSSLFDEETNCLFGTLSSTMKRIINVLRKDLSIQIFADYSVSPTSAVVYSRSKNNGKTAGCPVLEVNVVLYGPPGAFESIGIFATRCNIYLQHPRHCNRNVPYHNPHCLSLQDTEGLLAHDLETQLKLAGPAAFETNTNPIDIFLDARQQEHLSEAIPPSDLHTSLYKHQRQALTFMLQRESGWAMDGRHSDIWNEKVDVQGQKIYINNITGQKQIRPPEQFRGGLLIDAPGLGKSLSIIALIAADLEDQKRYEQPDNRCQTLLVVPKTLIQTWKDELQRHLKPSSSIRYCIYYGKARKTLLEHLDEYTLVITTYSIVRIDWKASLGVNRPGEVGNLHTATWRRVVLDEAHIAREPSKTFARSVCALRADRKWAVTGTPIQDRLTDLYSLFKFLQCSPFCDIKVFNTHVTHNWKARSDPYSVAKLKNLVNCLSIRRPKYTIELPPRQDRTVKLELNKEERQLYEYIRSSTLQGIGRVDREGGSANLFNVLRMLNRLRLVCNHGLQGKEYAYGVTQASINNLTWTQKAAQSRFDHLDAIGLARCSNPECAQDLSSALSSELDNEHEDEPYIEEALTVLCSTCVSDRQGAASRYLKVCNHFPRQFSGDCNDDMNDIFDAEDPFSIVQSRAVVDRAECVPTKIKRIVNDLLQTTDDTKIVVFTGWTKTLDILQQQLRSKSVRCVRLDGTSSATSRAKVLRVFRGDSGIKVLLATLSCGGVGLDLTAASQAYIVEPQWNPMSESQALDRIHRLGQSREVFTTRYVMKDTWEEQVIKLQQRKQELADLTLSSGAINKAELTYGRLQ